MSARGILLDSLLQESQNGYAEEDPHAHGLRWPGQGREALPNHYSSVRSRRFDLGLHHPAVQPDRLHPGGRASARQSPHHPTLGDIQVQASEVGGGQERERCV